MNQQIAYSNFINSIKAEETKTKYKFGLEDFIKFVKTDRLFKIKIEDKLRDYILDLRVQKLASNTINTRVAAVYHYYAMNDVILNKVKINKYKGEFRTVQKDRAYTHEEIHRVLDIADLRMKVCVLLMASSGCRLGALPDIKFKHLYYNQLTVYEGSSEEYYTFATPETLNIIAEYIKYRERFGEKVTSEAYLIRNDFNNLLSIKPRGVSKHTIRNVLWNLLVKAGVKVPDVHMTHGFRKFFTTQLVNSKVNPEIREMLLGHKIGLTGSYYKPTEQEMYTEYEKAINNLTINEEYRLRKQNTELQKKYDRLDHVLARIDIMEKKLGINQKVS